MAHYRIYPLDKQGCFVSGEDVTCGSDTEARELALQFLKGGQQAEIWTGTRLVGRVTAAIPAYGKEWLVNDDASVEPERIYRRSN